MWHIYSMKRTIMGPSYVYWLLRVIIPVPWAKMFPTIKALLKVPLKIIMIRKSALFEAKERKTNEKLLQRVPCLERRLWITVQLRPFQLEFTMADQQQAKVKV